MKNVNNITDDPYIVSLYVQSSYTNIPHTGIEAVKKSLQKSKSSISLSIIISFLRLTQTLNIFVLNNVNYLQKKGFVMVWFEEYFTLWY